MQDDLAYIGVRHVWGGEQPFGLLPADRRQHTYVIGKTGSGKTSLLRNFIIQDIAAGRGVGVIDPHGDLADSLLDQIPPWRTDHVVYFNPADRQYPVGINLLTGVAADDSHLIASGVVSSLKSIWRGSWGPRTEYLLYAAVAALTQCQNVTLLGVQRMFTDERYRRWVVRQVTDPVIRNFWTLEFESYDKRFRSEVIAPIQNKVGQLLSSPTVRNIIGQVRSRIDFRYMMDHNRVFIANLSKGQLGDDKSDLLGSLLVTQFRTAAMSRAEMPEQDRRDFFLFVDEFGSFCTDAFASILSEARKYRLCLTLSHQYLQQIPIDIRHAALGNAGTLISFRTSESDGRVIAREMANEFTAAQISSLENFEICVRTLEDGSGLVPFKARTLPPIVRNWGTRENVLARSRQRYSAPRTLVEDKINQWLGDS